ncbi:hypothetical protein KIN20_013368 [Parelaphostrongylus tenuis]|uniref:Uncharacterized protein n=1 Tax=Parelaphostrongylus tenuis TaxID=148309 RepID=A0AAD5MBZ2_PARTN|nr:hypothetical protein KIN20_013368 [Parelaphostrongylus tenuis]
MKRASQNADTTVAPGKCIKLNCEELKILSTTNKLNEANEMVRKLKARVAVSRRELSQKEEELKDLVLVGLHKARMNTAGVVKIEWFQASECPQSRENVCQRAESDHEQQSFSDLYNGLGRHLRNREDAVVPRINRNVEINADSHKQQGHSAVKLPKSQPNGYFVWSMLKEKVSTARHNSVDALKTALLLVWDEIQWRHVRASLEFASDFSNV